MPTKCFPLLTTGCMGVGGPGVLSLLYWAVDGSVKSLFYACYQIVLSLLPRFHTLTSGSSYTHTHARAHARTHARTHTQTHTTAHTHTHTPTS